MKTLQHGGWSIIPVIVICLSIIIYGLILQVDLVCYSGIPVYFCIVGIPAIIQIRMNIIANKIKKGGIL